MIEMCIRDSCTFEQVQAAAKIANADEFIREMPEGYDTIIGERGVGPVSYTHLDTGVSLLCGISGWKTGRCLLCICDRWLCGDGCSCCKGSISQAVRGDHTYETHCISV